ncbi:hypothetical protein CGMCC3_g13698 [Colletotrichum fructicola]|nr:uncharacterized protein CGMCC3_g13698 [Colletotrichum fructicola]KAE9570173.1 hypothetical protein CGMCC3_g13698 [Colletotrichum fructicola]
MRSQAKPSPAKPSQAEQATGAGPHWRRGHVESTAPAQTGYPSVVPICFGRQVVTLHK